MKKKHTNRGFGYYDFKDSNGTECNIQMSSSAMEPKIWLGSAKLDIKEFKAGSGWVDRPEFDESTMEHHFIGNNRMHLTRQQVKKLLPILEKFVETGEI